MNHKHKLRRLLIERRLSISSFRRYEARESILCDFFPKLKSFIRILSFASKTEEIDLWPLNELLLHENRLCLTKMIDSKLQPFLISDLELDLEETGKWKLKEPITTRCLPVQITKIDCILVPGLGFDKNHHRIGYGMGHFDRLLARVSCPTYGIGFKEQLLDELIPIEPHDIPLQEIFLF